jgi:hypothetical protein
MIIDFRKLVSVKVTMFRNSPYGKYCASYSVEKRRFEAE